MCVSAGDSLRQRCSHRWHCADPQTDYMLNCRGCHGPDGRGIAGGGAGVPRYRRQVPVGAGWARISRACTGHRAVGAQRRAHGGAAQLDRARVQPADLPADFAPYTAEEVAPLRRQPFADVVGVRRALTQEIAIREMGSSPSSSPAAAARDATCQGGGSKPYAQVTAGATFLPWTNARRAGIPVHQSAMRAANDLHCLMSRSDAQWNQPP